MILLSTPRIQKLISVVLATAGISPLPLHAEITFAPAPTEYVAALGDPDASSGTDAQTWGLWQLDPGPRGVWVKDYPELVANAGVAPSGWQFDSAGWWLEEHGLIMEAPTFPLPAGRYVVTGGRDITAILTIQPPDGSGRQAWHLSEDASIRDVTHLGCRAALYTPVAAHQSCSPAMTPAQVFPMMPDRSMPSIEGCSKRDYQVLIVIGMMVES